MMPALSELGASQCRYPVTPDTPFDFCGAPTDGRSYCPTHDKACHAGHGKDWRALAGMMAAVEDTIVFRTPHEERVGEIDSVLRDAETHFDGPLGLMGRT